MTALNVVAVALWTVGVFAAVCAGALDPAVRVALSTLSSIIKGGAKPKEAACRLRHSPSADISDVMQSRH